MARSGAAAASAVLMEMRRLNADPATAPSAEGLKLRYQSLESVYETLSAIYTRDRSLGGCGQRAEDLEPFPSPPAKPDF